MKVAVTNMSVMRHSAIFPVFYYHAGIDVLCNFLHITGYIVAKEHPFLWTIYEESLRQNIKNMSGNRQGYYRSVSDIFDSDIYHHFAMVSHSGICFLPLMHNLWYDSLIHINSAVFICFTGNLTYTMKKLTHSSSTWVCLKDYNSSKFSFDRVG